MHPSLHPTTPDALAVPTSTMQGVAASGRSTLSPLAQRLPSQDAQMPQSTEQGAPSQSQPGAACARAAFRYPNATSRLVLDGLGQIEERFSHRVNSAASLSRDHARQGLESARRIGGRVYGEAERVYGKAERHLVPRRLLELRSSQTDWRKRAALQVLSAFMVSLSLGLIALNAAVIVDAPRAHAASTLPQSTIEATAVQSLHAPPTPPPQGYVAQAMGRYSAMLPRPVVADIPMPEMDDLAPRQPTAAELRRQFALDRARFKAQNSLPEDVLAASAQRADEAARILAAHTPPTRDDASSSTAGVQMTTDPADVSMNAYDPANVGAAAAMLPQSP